MRRRYRSYRPDALVLARLLDALVVDVDRRIVGGRVRRGAVRHGLDERRPVAGPCARAPPRASPRRRRGRRCRRRGRSGSRSRSPCPRVSARRSAATAASRSPTGCCCRRGRPAPSSRRRRSRPRGRRPPRSRRRRRATSATRSSPLSAEPHAKPDGVRDLRRDRDADRRDVELGGVPPPGRVPAPPREHRRDRHPAQEPDGRLAVAPGRSSRDPRARTPIPPASPRGSRRSRTCRSVPAGGRRPSARRTSAGGRGRDTARSGRPRVRPETSPSRTLAPSPMTRRRSPSAGSTRLIASAV